MNMEARRRLEEVGGRPQEARERLGEAGLATPIDGGGWNTSLLQSGNARQDIIQNERRFLVTFFKTPLNQQKCKIFLRNK